MFDGSLRHGVDRVVGPVGRRLNRIGVTPNWLTLFGLAINVAAGVTIGLGRLFLGAWLLVAGNLMDLFDGAVAKSGDGDWASRRGAFWDSVADRISDVVLFGGVAWYLSGTRSPYSAFLPLGCLAAATLVSYLRAKADALGFDAHVGLMERAERLVLLGIGLFFAPFHVLVPALWVLLALTVLTALQRFFAVWRQGTTEPPLPIEEIRLLPGWREIRRELGAHPGETVSVIIRRHFEERREFWAQQRAQAQQRRQDIRRRQRELWAAEAAKRPRRRRIAKTPRRFRP